MKCSNPFERCRLAKTARKAGRKWTGSIRSRRSLRPVSEGALSTPKRFLTTEFLAVSPLAFRSKSRSEGDLNVNTATPAIMPSTREKSRCLTGSGMEVKDVRTLDRRPGVETCLRKRILDRMLLNYRIFIGLLVPDWRSKK